MNQLIPIIQAITFISVVGLAAIVAIFAIRPHEDNIQAMATIVGFLTPTLMAFLALMRSTENAASINKNKESIDNLHKDVCDTKTETKVLKEIIKGPEI